MISAKSLGAKMTLLGAVFKNLAVHVVMRRRGATAWLGRLRQEDIAPTPTRAWEILPATSRCIGCGLCDFVRIEGAAASTVSAAAPMPAAAPTMSIWMMGALRRPQDAPLAGAASASLRRQAEAIARLCPAQVSVEAIIELIEANAAGVTAAATGEEPA